MKWFLCLVLLIPAVASAQSVPPPPPIVIVIRPAAEPVPALKYRIVPERRELIPGNAAIFYHRAILLFSSRKLSPPAPTPGQKAPTSVEETIYHWSTVPFREIPLDEARAVLASFATTLHEVDLGAIRQTCDWEFEHRKEGIALLLPEIQEMRALALLVNLRARVALLDGKIDEAMHWLQVGFAMSRHTSQGPTLIQALVGNAIEVLMARTLEDLIQAPGSPNLYWALANRPRPFIDLAAALDGERMILERELPALRELDSGPWTLDKARRFGDDLRSTVGSWDGPSLFSPNDRSRTSATAPPQARGFAAQLALASMVAQLYPEARKALIAEGRPAAEVDAMPTIQVVAIHTLRAYDAFRDDIYKWADLPYWKSAAGFDATMTRATAKAKAENPLLALFTMTVPALQMARFATVRSDRQLDALQCIEAIRLYAASHGGTLPPTLDAITEAPTPLDPATGTPFIYKVDGTTATLNGPRPAGAPDHYTSLIRYDLKLAR